jgi:hypothetical protein
MTSDPSQRPVSPLRARMIEDMTVHGFNERTRGHYVRHVRAFAAFIGRSPDTATAEDVRLFQLHQTRSGVQPMTACGGVRSRNWRLDPACSVASSPSISGCVAPFRHPSIWCVSGFTYLRPRAE